LSLVYHIFHNHNNTSSSGTGLTKYHDIDLLFSCALKLNDDDDVDRVSHTVYVYIGLHTIAAGIVAPIDIFFAGAALCL